MENASKALIIAGAILLAILIIGLGMYIYTMAADSFGGANLDPQKISAYNSPFERYMNTQSGSNVRSLLTLVANHNNANTDDETQQVGVIMGSAAGITDVTNRGGCKYSATDINGADIKGKILAGKTYTVDFGYDKKSGLIIAVGIVEKK